MRLKEKILRWLTFLPKKDIYYHEAGHVIVAKIFEDALNVKLVTANPDESRIFDPQSLAGTRISYKRKPIQIGDVDAMLLVNLGGLVVDEITINNGKIPYSFHRPNVWRKKLQQKRYDGDVEGIEKHFPAIRHQIKIELEEYICVSIKFLHEIIQNNEVWDAVNSIRSSLINSPYKRLTGAEIDAILRNGKFLEWLNNNRKFIQNERMKTLSNSKV